MAGMPLSRDCWVATRDSWAAQPRSGSGFGMSADSRRLLCISLHDVAPATLDDCANTLAFLDDLGLGPVALLVVPDYHGLGRADRDDRFASFIASRILRGDEVVLHGYRHTDTAPRPCGIREWLVRRVYTDNEGEFSQLDFEMARTRILRGLVVLRSAGWHPTGFVAPAWLMSPSALCALEETPLQYCATRVCGGTRRRDPVTGLPHRVWSSALVRPATRALADVESGLVGTSCDQHGCSRRIASSRPALPRRWSNCGGRLLSQLEDREVVTEAQLIPPPSRAALLRGTPFWTEPENSRHHDRVNAKACRLAGVDMDGGAR